jgi:dTDP-4-dehydrorhamnose reductase
MKQENNKILLVGGDAGLAKHIKNHLNKIKREYYSTTRRLNIDDNCLFLDLNNVGSFQNLFNLNISTLILAASICDVDKCEKNKMLTRKINVDNTFELLRALKNHNHKLKIIMLSTDMVFDGAAKKPNPNEIKKPLTEYGRQKAELEDKLLNNFQNIKILRFGKIIDKNFGLFKKWINDLSQDKCIFPFYDLYFSPISIDYAIQAIFFAEESPSESNEIFHVSSGIDISYFDAAQWLANKLNKSNNLIKKISVHQKYPFKIVCQRIALGNNLNTNSLNGINALNIFLE